MIARLLTFFKAQPLVARAWQRLGKSPVHRRLARGSFWILLGATAWRLPSAISTFIVARILGPVGFGEFGMIFSTVSMLSIYGSLRLGAASTKLVAEHRHRDPLRAARVLKLTLSVTLVTCLIVSLALALAAPWLAATSLRRPELATGLAVGAVLLFFLMYGGMQEAGLAGLESFRATSRVNAFRGLATLMLAAPLALMFGSTGAIAALAIVSAIACLWLAALLRRECRLAGLPSGVPLRGAAGERVVLWSFALPGLLTWGLILLTTWLGRIILVDRPNGYAELGLFEAANQWRSLVLFLPAVMVRAILPILSDTFGRRGTSEYGDVLSAQLRGVCLTTVPLVILTIGFAEFLAAVFGARFSGAATIIPPLMVSIFVFGLSQALRLAFDGAGRVWTGLALQVVWAVVFLVAAQRLVGQVGPVGLAWAYLLSELVLFALQAIYVNRRLAPGRLRQLTPLFGVSLFLIAIQYAAWRSMAPVAAAATAVVLATVFVAPFVRRTLGNPAP